MNQEKKGYRDSNLSYGLGGDNLISPMDSEEPIFSSLTEGIEWVFQNTQARDYLIKAADGAVFVYSETEISYKTYERLSYHIQRLLEGFGIKKCDIWSISNESNRSVKR